MACGSARITDRDPVADRAMAPPAGSARAALARLRAAASATETLHAGDVVKSIGPGSGTILLMAPALIVVTPLSAIPGLSTLCGITIALFSLQILVGRRLLWLPAWLARCKMPAARLRAALDRLDSAAGLLDRMTHRRLTVLVRPPGLILPRATCFVCGAAMPVLELVPMASSILGAAVTLFAVAMLTRDGLLVVAGLAVVAQIGWVFVLLG